MGREVKRTVPNLGRGKKPAGEGLKKRGRTGEEKSLQIEGEERKKSKVRETWERFHRGKGTTGKRRDGQKKKK